MLRRALLTLFVVVVIAAACPASNDETAMGVYSYSGKSLRLSLLFDLDGAKNVVINGRSYAGIFPVSESGRHDGISTYSLSVQDKTTSRTIQLTVLFDDDDAVKAVVGFYSERSQVASGGSAGLSNVHVFLPIFKRLDLEMLPSQKKKR